MHIAQTITNYCCDCCQQQQLQSATSSASVHHRFINLFLVSLSMSTVCGSYPQYVVRARGSCLQGGSGSRHGLQCVDHTYIRWLVSVSLVHYSSSCTPLLSVPSCFLNHHLYADDTRLFLSFLPTHLDSRIDHLHDALDRISSWITANLLTLNSP